MKIPAQMTAVVLTVHGELDSLEVRKMDTPVTEQGAALIKVRACGLNNTDVDTHSAWYSGTVSDALGVGTKQGFGNAQSKDANLGSKSLSFPVIQGAGVAGVIVEVDAGVPRERIGQRVAASPWLSHHTDWQDTENNKFFQPEANGDFVKHTTIRAENALLAASPLSDAELATFARGDITAEYLISRTKPVAEETDVVGGNLFLRLLRPVRQGGRYSAGICISGQMTELELQLLIYKHLQSNGTIIASPGMMQRVLKIIEKGLLRPLLAATFPLGELAKAQKAFFAKTHLGNNVVRP